MPRIPVWTSRHTKRTVSYVCSWPVSDRRFATPSGCLWVAKTGLRLRHLPTFEFSHKLDPKTDTSRREKLSPSCELQIWCLSISADSAPSLANIETLKHQISRERTHPKRRSEEPIEIFVRVRYGFHALPVKRQAYDGWPNPLLARARNTDSIRRLYRADCARLIRSRQLDKLVFSSQCDMNVLHDRPSSVRLDQPQVSIVRAARIGNASAPRETPNSEPCAAGLGGFTVENCHINFHRDGRGIQAEVLSDLVILATSHRPPVSAPVVAS